MGQEQAEAVPVFCDVGQSFAECRFPRDTGAVLSEACLEVADDRRLTLLPCREARSGIKAPDVGFDTIEIADTLHAILGNRRAAGPGDLHKFAPGMRPKVGQGDIMSRLEKAIVVAIAIDLQDALEATQDLLGVPTAAPGRVAEGYSKWRRATPGTVVSRQGSEVSGLRLLPPGVEHRARVSSVTRQAHPIEAAEYPL
ncbi:hypothetical protein EDD52_1088 [Primorskyibacter sedentarius]|uniref:Uncharacterized protein n=1 Tax=Primorskyibacter sedentarius TaxID=745311 RepID=A0A4R3JAV4_9RHOB|nr:hypothetical protein EDD52_1088 [Primorskyibacter sedentarius]